MSNVMDLKRLQNHVSRNAFDLSERKCFTAKVGELLPVFVKEVLPGDSFDMSVQSFTRTQPVNTAAFTRIREYYDYFFVPYRLLWRFFPEMISITNSQSPVAASLTQKDYVTTKHPYLSPSGIASYFSKLKACGQARNKSVYNYFGFYRGDLSVKLLHYLGLGCLGGTMSTYKTDSSGNQVVDTYGSVGSSSPVSLNAFPLLAYQKICQDYFRNSQWETSNPTLYNVDYLSSRGNKLNPELPIGSLIPNLDATTVIPRNLFDLNYCNWNKDLFTGVLPNNVDIQLGSVKIPDELQLTDVNLSDGQLTGTFTEDTDFTKDTNVFGSDATSGYFKTAGVRLSNEYFSTFGVLALRQAEALQKWSEISMSGQQNYKDQVERHFGVKVPSSMASMCEWIGGCSDNLDITEIVNTNLQGIDDGTSQADIAGKGVGTVGQKFHFENKNNDYGLLMCIYHAVPLLDYEDSVTLPLWFKTQVFDYAIPEFDKVGLQSLPGICLSNQFQNGSTPNVNETVEQTSQTLPSIGYVPRYVDYKTSIDVVTGAFTDTLRHWTAAVGNDYFKAYLSNYKTNKQLDYSFFKVNPAVLDTIFAVNANGSWNTDNLLLNSYHDVKVVRNLDYDGLPY